jgi:hypothetical protein
MNLRDATDSRSPHAERWTGDISVWSESIPLRERLLDRLADLLFCADDTLTMLGQERDVYLAGQCDAPLRAVFESVNELLKKLCD